tara:strand:- start:294 stop:608 length:315 start_codon:yes stop_codon:yes gene_type:complete
LGDVKGLIEELYDIIKSRKNSDPNVSYTANKFAKGTDHIAKKIGEEATEVAIAAAQRDEDAIKLESADLLYHLFVLWADQNIKPDEIFEVLSNRRGISGLDAKK